MKVNKVFVRGVSAKAQQANLLPSSTSTHKGALSCLNCSTTTTTTIATSSFLVFCFCTFDGLYIVD